MPIFTTTELACEVRQSEIISGLRQHFFTSVGDDVEVESSQHAYSIVLSQDCDLLWDRRARDSGAEPTKNGVLLFECTPSDIALERISGSKERRRAKQNQDERYHTLEEVPIELDLLGLGLPSLIIDFKRYFTLPALEIERQYGIEGDGGARRRCRLETPFREHLQNRFCHYFSRVGLPVREGE